MMNRRRFLRSVSVGLLAAPLVAEAQPGGKVYRIGHIFTGEWGSSWSAFVQGLSSLGWVEGKNIVFEHRDFTYTGRFAESDLQAISEELVRIKVDVIVLWGGNRAQMIQKVTSTIPIVILSSGELVASGIVQSLTRPGGNITGVQNYTPELQGKRLQILKELVPTLSRVAVLRRGVWHPGILAAYRQAADDAAKKLGLRLHYVVFQTPDELPSVFAGMVNERDRAIVIWGDPGIFPHVRQILDLAAQHRLPTMVDPSSSRAGALMAYGAKQDDLWRQAATHVDRILKGAKPGDLPIGQPTTFELAINLKTAKALGLTIPASLLQRADHVIE
jgi:putative tryptophan/tyrosine transport system substrate-binding protein